MEMNKQEFSKWAMALKTYYPREQILPNQQAMELWFNALNDLSMDVAEAALMKWVATNKWSPTIAEIRETATGVKHGAKKDWSEAWADVRTAIAKFGMYRPGEALESLEPVTREAVRRLGFYNLCVSENEISDRARFKEIYEGLADGEHIQQLLPIGLKDVIAKIQGDERLQIESGDAN